MALQLRRQWLKQHPTAVPVKRALQWAQQGLQSAESDGALQKEIQKESLLLLKQLRAGLPDDKEVMQALADALEAAGEYREAALLYRELLK